MNLVRMPMSADRIFQINLVALAKDLHEVVFGPGGYWSRLQHSADLQSTFLDFMNEPKSSELSIKP